MLRSLRLSADGSIISRGRTEQPDPSLLTRRCSGRVQAKFRRFSATCWCNPKIERRRNQLEAPAAMDSRLDFRYVIGRDISYSIMAGSFGYGSVRPVLVNPKRS